MKSPPELWAEVSDLESLARHLGDFGEIRITRLETEQTVAWEGDRASGTVELAASGWGTKVTLTAAMPETGREQRTENRAQRPRPSAARAFPIKLTFRARLKRWLNGPEPVVVEPEPTSPNPNPNRSPSRHPAPSVLAVLNGVLDHLGSAHHRPFSRG